jgi:uncharacterized membrane protein
MTSDPAVVRRPGFSRERLSLLSLIGLCAILFSYLSVARHYGFQTSAYDLAMYDQAVWNTSQGRPFEINLLEDTMPGLSNKLGDHVEPILLPLAALYWIRSNPDVLLVAQAMALAALIWPLYQLVRTRSRSVGLAAVAVALYLLHPGMWNALLFDFHPVTLGAAFLVFALWLLVQQKHWAALTCAVLALMCKEQIGLSVMLLGVYAAFFVRRPARRAPAAAAGQARSEAESKGASRLARFFQARDWRFGLLLIVIGAAWSVIALGVIIPAFQPSGSSYYLNRYGRLGSTFAEVLVSPLTRQDLFWSIISGPKRVAYYGDLLLPLGFLPLLGGELLLPALPDIGLNTLSAFAPSRTLDYHYAILSVPFLVLATAWGIDRLARWLGRKTPQARRGVMMAASAFALVAMGAYQLDRYHGFVPLSERYAGTYTIAPRDPIGWQLAAQLPPGAIVSGQFNLLPHVSQRQRAHIFPRVEDAQYVFLDTRGVIEPFQTQAEYEAAVTALRADPNYETVSEQDGFILFRHK